MSCLGRCLVRHHQLLGMSGKTSKSSVVRHALAGGIAYANYQLHMPPSRRLGVQAHRSLFLLRHPPLQPPDPLLCPQTLFPKDKPLQLLLLLFASGWSSGVIHLLGAPEHDRMHSHDQPGPQSPLPASPLPTRLLRPHTGGPLSS